MKFAEICHDEQRRLRTRKAGLNGIDYVEIEHTPDVSTPPTLVVYFFRNVPDQLIADHVTIEGGTRITGIQVTDVQLDSATDTGQEDCARLSIDREGDRSTYTLRITGLEGFDPIYASFDFIFRPECPGDLDCREERVRAEERQEEPEINYLAKDYQGFLQLILDRWASILPTWKERHVPDLGIALAEVLAYVGDYLSYYQDAVATEAYLGTARRRVSVRRHARLVDYSVHEGCNARALICVDAGADTPDIDPSDVFFITNCSAFKSSAPVLLQEKELESLPSRSFEVFEPVGTNPLRFYETRNRIDFYTWGNAECCLPKGATSATLIDKWVEPSAPPPGNDKSVSYDQATPGDQKLALPTKKTAGAAVRGSKQGDNARDAYEGSQNPRQGPADPVSKPGSIEPGDILIFVEVIGPNTGDEADADPLHRHPVRITRVERAIDPLDQTRVIHVWWDSADALPFPLCISSVGCAPQCKPIDGVSVAQGNVVLVDHGHRVDNEPLEGCVSVETSEQGCLGAGRPTEPMRVPGSFLPALRRGPLTFAAQVQANTPASKLLEQDPSQTLPSVTLTMVTLTGVWSAEIHKVEDKPPGTGMQPRDKGTKGKDSSDAANFILQQTCEHLEGVYAGALGAFKISGGVNDLGVWFKQIPDSAAAVTFSGALKDGVLEGDLNVGGSVHRIRATRRRKEPAWTPRRDLLSSGPRDAHFVVETDDDGVAHFRFGDGELGRAPESGAGFNASYRVGNGLAGNLGSGAIVHMVLRKATSGLGIAKVTNPLPAAGGVEPETLADIKLLAPSAFRSRLERAITADDYATLAERHPKVQRAAATLRFTGSRYAVQVAIDPFGTEQLDPTLLEEIKSSLYRYRRVGHDLEVVPAHYVALDIGLEICVRPGYLAAHVKKAVLDVLGGGVLPDGRLGLFHPDKLTFGGSIYLSPLVGAVQAVDGVEAVQVTTLERLYAGPSDELENGVLPIGPLEVARLDNDPNYPENGRLRLTMRGGR